MRQRQKILLDTDAGTDVDDVWALAMVLSVLELLLVGVTTVYGDIILRGAIVRTLLRLASRSDISVAVGEQQPLTEGATVYWPGHEGRGLLRFDGTDPTDFHPLSASDYIIESSLRYAGELLIVAIGPLTNIATALLKDPILATRLQGIVVMGGGYREWRNRREHNFRSDPKAAEIVLRSGAPIKMVGYNVTDRCQFRWRELTQLTTAPKPFVAALRALTDHYFHVLRERREERWQKMEKAADQKWLADPYIKLHDPLTVATVVNP